MQKDKNVLVLFLTFGDQKQQEVLDFVIPLFQNCKSYHFDIVRIDNKDLKSWNMVYTHQSNISLYDAPGDNTHYEMSGWSKGYEVAKENLKKDYDLVIVLNDALLNSKPKKVIQSIDNNLLLNLEKYNGVAGFIDTFSRVSPEPINTITNPMKILDNKTRWWVCSTCIILKEKTFKKILPIGGQVDCKSLYYEDYDLQLFRDSKIISENYQKFLINHQTKKWYKKYKISNETYSTFKLKTECIISEHLLSIRLKFHSNIFVDLTQYSKRHGRIGRKLTKIFGPSFSFFIKVIKTYINVLREQIKGMS